MDNEIKGVGNSLNYKYRMHDSRLGRFFAIDPLFKKYPHYSPYSFSGNKVIHAIELEGLEEFVLPRFGPITLPRPIFTIPRAPTIPIPTPPTLPAPPIVLEPTIEQIPVHPAQPVYNSNFESAIDWNNPPSSPDELGDDWEDITHPENNSGKREFRHKDTGEKIRWDPGEKGKPGFKGKDHWHRYNPNTTGDKDLYLDRFGNPVSKGTKASHIEAGQSFLEAIPSIIDDVNEQIDKLKEQRNNLSILKIDDWGKIKKIWDNINKLKDYIDKLKEYKEKWDDYNKKLDEYYKNCDNCKA